VPHILGFDNSDVFMSKIIESPEGNYLVGCRINKKESNMRLFYLCDNPNIVLNPDQELTIEGLKIVMQKLSTKDVIPYDQPISLIKDFKTYSNLFIFSFILFT